MNQSIEGPQPSRSRIVLVVGVDMSDVSEHLLEQTRSLIRPVDDAEIHVVHVVHPDSLTQRLARPVHSDSIAASSQTESAKWQIERLCHSLARAPGSHVHVHTPIGNVADELTRVAARVAADILVVEAHDHGAHSPRRMFHRSVVSRIARTAPCTVLTIRKPSPTGPEQPAARPEAPLSTTWSANP
ncbi:MAG: universal stress protein [Polyangiaceae bacterium]